ncbi:hypothetical protein SLEP1_g56519 [Rubroshorea leprosula]|uniref:Uncharacterized protein n=1 Tax=Rubroshorea leprosula TaxID=152421 RepID=A0AAV5MJW5_9ROSI|nr:hypothetical protein SLEP1_g56519 [Rubroshorea leprosula]
MREASNPKADLAEASNLETNLEEAGETALQGGGGESRSVGGRFEGIKVAEEEDEAAHD